MRIDFTGWNVTGFSLWCLLPLSGYVKAFQIHGDGEPQLLFYETADLKAIGVSIWNDTTISRSMMYIFHMVAYSLKKYNIENLMLFDTYVCKMKELNIVINFVRYHPVLANALLMEEVRGDRSWKTVVALDLTSPEVIWANISKNRNVIRKAEKWDRNTSFCVDKILFKDFICIL